MSCSKFTRDNEQHEQQTQNKSECIHKLWVIFFSLIFVKKKEEVFMPNYKNLGDCDLKSNTYCELYE